MRDDFSVLCGITKQELLTQLKSDIERMPEANAETYEEACLLEAAVWWISFK